jgi:general secretion pathway protein D
MIKLLSIRRTAGVRCIALWLSLGLGALTPAWAQVTLNLKDADIGVLITTVSEVTGKNFIVDPRVKGKVTVISATPMDASGVYETFLAVLQVQGFAAVPSGDAIKIIPETNVRQEGSGYTGASGRAQDEIVTQVYSIQNVSAVQLVPILRPLVPQWGALAAYAPSNMLIISDRAANVARIDKLIRQIDQSSDREIELVKLQHASAADVVRTVTALTQGEKQGGAEGGGSQGAVVIADERSNSVLIGGDKSERSKLLSIIGQLDTPVGEEGGTQVQYLNYADAENLAPILEGYAQQLNDTSRGPATAATQGAAGGGGGGNSQIKVLADKDTNALIITAPPKLMRQIRDVVAQLDIRRRQVLVEGIIAELSASKSSQLGVDWAVFNGNRVAAAGILNPDTLTGLASAVSSGSSAATAAASAIGQGINIAGGVDGGDSGTSWALLLKALKGDGNSNVLSTPSLTTMDNEEAEFSVGQEVPFVTGSFSNTGSSSSSSSVNPFQTINREEVGLKLKITPQINEGSSIKLKIELEVSSLASAVTGAVDLVTNKRTLTNTVMVENGQILVLGGLIDDNVNDTKRSVPFIGDIPLIGSLFRYRSLSREKRNLMVFIKPAILGNVAQGDYYTRRKYESVRMQQIEAFQTGAPVIGGTRPVLQGFDEYRLEQGPDGATQAAPPSDAESGGAPTPIPPQP